MGIFLELWNAVADEWGMMYLIAVIGTLRPHSHLLARWSVNELPPKLYWPSLASYGIVNCTRKKLAILQTK